MIFLRKIIDIIFPPSYTEQKLVEMCEHNTLPTPPPVPHKDITAATHYQHPIIKQAIRILKTKHNVPIAQCFAHKLHEDIQARIEDHAPFHTYNNIVLIPLPTTKQRLRERGFNQSELIAQEITHHDSHYVVQNILHKDRETKKQSVSISKSQRKENIKGCFSCRKNSRKQHDILYIVIDDVVTTGATLNEALKTLRKNGYKPVIGCAAAH